MTSYFSNNTSLMPLYEIHLIFRVRRGVLSVKPKQNFLTSQNHQYFFTTQSTFSTLNVTFKQALATVFQ